jgi:hypothetical protein
VRPPSRGALARPAAMPAPPTRGRQFRPCVAAALRLLATAAAFGPSVMALPPCAMALPPCAMALSPCPMALSPSAMVLRPNRGRRRRQPLGSRPGLRGRRVRIRDCARSHRGRILGRARTLDRVRTRRGRTIVRRTGDRDRTYRGPTCRHGAGSRRRYRPQLAWPQSRQRRPSLAGQAARAGPSGRKPPGLTASALAMAGLAMPGLEMARRRPIPDSARPRLIPGWLVGSGRRSSPPRFGQQARRPRQARGQVRRTRRACGQVRRTRPARSHARRGPHSRRRPRLRQPSQDRVGGPGAGQLMTSRPGLRARPDAAWRPGAPRPRRLLHQGRLPAAR